MTITVSTDGSALGNPNGPMGWAWADHEPAAGGKPGHEHAGDCDAGGATNGTNQIGELCAVLEALRAHPGSEDLVIETDSQYAINCSTKWVQGWKRNGWKNSQKKPVKNADLIRAIDIETGKTIWSDVLPAGGQANPMIYEQDGRQYLVIVAAGHHFMQTPEGDYVIAYALPKGRA